MEPPCRKHKHPSLKRGVSREQVRRELAELYHQAGYRGPVDLAWTDDLRRTHNRNTRRYAQVMPFLETPHFEFAPQMAFLPYANRRALEAHEIGHVLDPYGDEDEADEAARRALGIRIRYDHRWPGKGLQTTRDNPRRRGYLLDELLSLAPAGHKTTDELRAAQRVLADEPMRWYFEESDKEYWNEREEFRNVAPAYPILWVEHQAPRFIRSEEYGVAPWPEGNWQRAGTLLVTESKDNFPERVVSNFPTAKWITRASVYTSADRYGAPGIKWTYVFGVEADGSLSHGVNGAFLTFPEGPFAGALEGMPKEAYQEVANFYKGPWRVALLALYFMHAKGTTLRPARVPPKVAARRRKRGRPTGEGYKILDVGLGARKTLAEAKAEGGGSQSALRKHLRRGGFAVYRPEKPHVSGFVGPMWRSPTVVGRGEEEVEKDYRVRSRRKKRKRKKRRNPSTGERARDAHRRWNAHGDEEAFQEWLGLRERMGLSREPRDLASWEEIDRETATPTVLRSLAVQHARPSHRRKRMKVVEAENVIMTWLRERGWSPDTIARSTTPNELWINPEHTQRIRFRRSVVVFEVGQRGAWNRNLQIHRWGEPLGTIDFAERLLRNTRVRLARHVTDPYAPNPELPSVPRGERFLPARIQASGEPPRRHSFELMATGEAPLIYLPAGAVATSLPEITSALSAMLSRHPQRGGLADPAAWLDLEAAIGHQTTAKLYVVDRNGERWRVLRVNWDPGGYTGEVEVKHQGRFSRGGRTRWLDLEQFYGQMIPLVVFKGRRQ